MLKTAQLQKFIEIYQKRFGRKLDEKEAYQKGMQLVSSMRTAYKPMTARELQELQERRASMDQNENGDGQHEINR